MKGFQGSMPKPRAVVAGAGLIVLAGMLLHGVALATNAPSALPPSKIVFVSARDGNSEIYTVDVNGADLTRLTTHAAVDEDPSWSPDGQHIAFASNRSGAFEIYVMKADGSDVVQRTFSSSYSEHPTWSPDGESIVYSTLSNGSANLWRVGAFSGTPSLLFSAPGWDGHPDWSPDGARLVLVSDWYAYDFVQDIFLVNADGSEFTGLTGNIFDHVDYVRPAWSPNGSKFSMAIVQTTGVDQYITHLGTMNQDGSELKPLAPAATWTRSSWSPNGQWIVYTSPAKDVVWIDANGSASGTVIPNGWNADWSPLPSVTTVETGGHHRSDGVRVLTSPSHAPVRFVVERQGSGDELDIYDVSGRRVGRVPLGASGVVVWDWRQDGHAPGVYFARLHSGRGPAVRFVVLR